MGAGPPEDGAAGSEHRAGFVALIGQPNTGKSTLLNRMLGEKVAIVTSRPQTTRNRILGVFHAPDLQVAFLDTPGIHQAKKGLNRYMVEVAFAALMEVDAVLVMIDSEPASRRVDAERGTAAPDERDAEIIERAAGAGRPMLLALNKVDRVRRELLLPLIDAYSGLAEWSAVHPISARTGEGLDELPRSLSAVLPPSPPLFPDDVLTDQAERLIAAEYIREQVIRNTRQEVPYATAVEVLLFDESEREGRGRVRIEANIVVERNSQKGIVIGKGGAMLKKIGSAARADLERLLGARVWLGLHVRVEPDWTRTAKGLKKLGYS